MSAADMLVQKFNHKCILFGLSTALMLIMAPPALTEQVGAEAKPGAGSDPTIEELHEHSETIAVILETASQRVDRLSTSSAETPMLLEAIRQEISLSRRWNRHLGTILNDVAEARRALGEREREAAKEIARMTAAAEEARLELIALRGVLEGVSADPANVESGWSDGGLQGGSSGSDGMRTASSRSASGVIAEDGADDLHFGDLHDARLGLASMQDAQMSALRDVESVRGKIIEALQTLAAAHGEIEYQRPRNDDELTSGDITAWAASMATRLHSDQNGKSD